MREAHRLLCHSTLGLRVIKKKKKKKVLESRGEAVRWLFEEARLAHPNTENPGPEIRNQEPFSSVLLSSLELSDTQVYEP